MEMRFPLHRFMLALLSMSFIYAGSAAAQSYPNRPIRLIIPWPTGGGTDVTFRLWAPQLAENLGQQIVIDNLPSYDDMMRKGVGAFLQAPRPAR